MRKNRELARRRRQLEQARRELGSSSAPRLALPVAAFVAGALVPVLSGTGSANPLRQVAGLVRGAGVRLIRMTAYRKLFALLGIAPSAGVASQSGSGDDAATTVAGLAAEEAP